MNIQKFTQKSVEAINDCEKLAYEYGNQEIEQEHLLVALLQQEDGLILKLIEKMDIQKEHFLDNAKKHLAARVKVSGGQVYVGQDLNKVLIHAEDEAKQMGDEYVSVEHLFLALLKYPNKAMKEIFKEYGITRDRFLQALSTVRGNQRVVSDNPEATYDTLEKYGYDMVARAKEQIDTCPASREDLKAEYQFRYDVISEYAPKQMSADEVKAYIQEKFADVLATKNKGAIMKAVMADMKGKADGKVINQTVAELCK